ncbi:hypothetical protein EMCRGX_G028922 [Ephydatia muelleri]
MPSMEVVVPRQDPDWQLLTSRTPSIMVVPRPLIIMIGLLYAGSVAADDCFCNDNVCLYEPIRSQLTSTTNADSLLLAFFTTIPFYGSVKISTVVNLTVQQQGRNNIKTNSSEMMWMHFWYPYSSTGVLRKLFPSFFRGAMDPWSALPVVAEVVSKDYFVLLNLTLNISCVSTTPGPPNLNSIDKGLNGLYASILQWGKSFGRTNGPVVYGDDTDRGIVYDAVALSHTDSIAFSIFVVLYVVFNAAVAMILNDSCSNSTELIAVSFLPVVVSILTDTFRSIAVFGLLFTTIACIVVCSAALIQTCKDEQSVPKTFLFLSIGSCFLCCLTVGIFTAYFLILSQEGLDADTLAGYVLSVIPTLALATLAYLAENILISDNNTAESRNDRKKNTINEDNSGEGTDEMNDFVNGEVAKYQIQHTHAVASLQTIALESIQQCYLCLNLTTRSGTHLNLTTRSGTHLNLTPRSGTHLNLTTRSGTHLNLTPRSGTHLNLTPRSGTHLNLTPRSGTHLNLTTRSGTHLNLTPRSGTHLNLTPCSGTHLNLTTRSGTHLNLTTRSGTHLNLTTRSGTHLNLTTRSGTHLNLTTRSGTRFLPTQVPIR